MYIMETLKQCKVKKDAKFVRNVAKIISENNNRRTSNDFIFAFSFIFYFCQKSYCGEF